MDMQQREWTERHCNELKAYLSSHVNINEEISTAAIGYVSVIVSLAKGSDEVRNALFDVLEEFDKRSRPK